MKKTFLLPLLAGLFVLNLATAQDKYDFNPCGTIDGKSDWLRNFQKNMDGYPRTGDTLYVPITVHIVGTDAGGGYFSTSSLYKAFCTLNKDFEPTGIQFFIEGDINYIANSLYYEHDWNHGGDMMDEYQVHHTINCYIVSDPAGNCGYSSYNNGVALAKSCINPNDHTWAHELGHYLSLPHPFYGWEGYDHDYSQPAPFEIDGHMVERLDGVLCDEAADGFCDTAPDYLAYRWGCDSEGFSSVKQVDPNGEEFYSDGTLYMSYSFDNCSNRFSDDQMNAMRANLLTEKEDYLYNQTPIGPVDMSNFTPLSPATAELVPFYNAVDFAWEPVANATQYTLEVTPLENFAIAQFRYVTDGTSMTSYDLFPNKKYYWRVSALNNYHTCLSVSEIYSFETGDVLNATHEAEQLAAISLTPNPVMVGSQLVLRFESKETQSVDFQLMTTAGQAVQKQTLQVLPGQQNFQLSTEGLTPGLYLLQLRTASGVYSEKLVIAR